MREHEPCCTGNKKIHVDATQQRDCLQLSQSNSLMFKNGTGQLIKERMVSSTIVCCVGQGSSFLLLAMCRSHGHRASCRFLSMERYFFCLCRSRMEQTSSHMFLLAFLSHAFPTMVGFTSLRFGVGLSVPHCLRILLHWDCSICVGYQNKL